MSLNQHIRLKITNFFFFFKQRHFFLLGKQAQNKQRCPQINREKNLKCYLTPFGCIKKVLPGEVPVPLSRSVLWVLPSSSAKHCLVQGEAGRRQPS